MATVSILRVKCPENEAVFYVLQALLPTWLLSCFSATWGLGVKVQQGKSGPHTPINGCT